MSAYREGPADPDAADREMLALERYGAWRSSVTARVMAGFGAMAIGAVLATVVLLVALLGGGPTFLLLGAGALVGGGVLAAGALAARRMIALRGPAKLRELAAAHETPVALLEATTSVSEQL